jgi:sporulation protein YlmC with PRC-barrel domain
MQTTLSNTSLVSSEDVEGTNVYDTNGGKIGDIDHLVIDKASGRVMYAITSFGGFIGLGQSNYPLPWQTLTYDPNLDGYRTAITEEQLNNAPSYGENSWTNRNWETELHKYYNVPPYWA